jgi:hypothetical protein
MGGGINVQCLWHVFIFQNGESFRKWNFHVVSLSFVSREEKLATRNKIAIVINPLAFHIWLTFV